MKVGVFRKGDHKKCGKSPWKITQSLSHRRAQSLKDQFLWPKKAWYFYLFNQKLLVGKMKSVHI